MTEQERSFEAWWNDSDVLKPFNSGRAAFLSCFLQGWKRERVKAEPFKETYCGESISYSLRDHVYRWVNKNGIEPGTKLRVTIEEMP